MADTAPDLICESQSRPRAIVDLAACVADELDLAPGQGTRDSRNFFRALGCRPHAEVCNVAKPDDHLAVHDWYGLLFHRLSHHAEGVSFREAGEQRITIGDHSAEFTTLARRRSELLVDDRSER
jgi:hypothetical protein